MTVITTPLGFLVALGAVTDLRMQKIPNVITLPAAMMAIIFHLHQSGLSGFYWSLSGWGLGLALLIAPYAMNAMGAGDVKLLAAIGAAVGPLAVFIIFLYSAIAGGAYALLHRIISQERFQFSGEIYQSVKHFILFRKLLGVKNKSAKKGPRLCYGLAIAVGTYIYIGEMFGLYRIIGV